MSHEALNPEQFREHLTVGETGTMSPAKLTEYWDPALKDPETFRGWTGPGYVENLAADIKKHGMQKPVQIKAGRHAYIYDGHHRVLAARDIGMKEVPYRVVSGIPGEQ